MARNTEEEIEMENYQAAIAPGIDPLRLSHLCYDPECGADLLAEMAEQRRESVCQGVVLGVLGTIVLAGLIAGGVWLVTWYGG